MPAARAERGESLLDATSLSDAEWRVLAPLLHEPESSPKMTKSPLQTRSKPLIYNGLKTLHFAELCSKFNELD